MPADRIRIGRPCVPNREQQRQREVVPQNAVLVDAVQLERIDVQRVITDRLACLGEVDDLGKNRRREAGVDRAELLEDLSDRVFGQVVQMRPGQQLDDPGWKAGRHLSSDVSLF